MSRRKDISILNIKNHKDWVSSWYIHKKEYFSLLQEDVMFYVYMRSKLRYFLINSVTNLKLVRLMDLLIIIMLNNSLSKGGRNFKQNSVLKRIVSLRKNMLFSFLVDASRFFKKNLFLSTFKIFTSYNVLNSSTISLKIARLIERRIRFRSKLIKTLIKNAKKRCKGIYIECTGRINNVDMARNDSMYLGSVPFQSLGLFVDYGFAVANTVKGLQSIKVWIYR
uniref:Ribosomal protein S3 n=1 Tax=Guillardia theta TaxID=55529 RepID=A0A481WAY1_GUITH|nr:ribosomal protein S3 [Guillardia theta]QBJ06302.1 ribosomal protein S3 [Guillardia theta]